MERAAPRRVILFVLIDGLADVTLRELGNRTTLEAAKTPAMDAIARAGLNGLLDPVAPGFACGSDTAHMSIFGYDPLIHYRGRGSFEAMGAGLPMDKGDVAFKCNFATVKKVLNAVSDTIHTQLSSHPINVQREQAGQPPANIVLLRGPGERINVPTFEEVHGLKAFMIAPTCIIAGLGMSLGIELIKAPGATGDYHTNLVSKAETALQSIERGSYDFGFVHVKAVDDAGHDKDVQKKVHFIEKADEMIAHLIEGFHDRLPGCEVTMVVTGDHTTPVIYGDHSFEPVPFAIARGAAAWKALNHPQEALPPTPLTDDVACFSEIAAARGVLGRFSGDQLMSIVKNFRSFDA
ncbi:hypothetical protein P43SY_002086 [Pythium insidiosum]|uniref:Metalloenzyme domain-containing protein n=1 Tax=Pythium insidiosum TaxID=114742 RepID=A0AAD5QA29_PYTIN|nr:hypothetical protein P43SY_002086 [Pythium insidiosum]